MALRVLVTSMAAVVDAIPREQLNCAHAGRTIGKLGWDVVIWGFRFRHRGARQNDARAG